MSTASPPTVPPTIAPIFGFFGEFPDVEEPVAGNARVAVRVTEVNLIW